MNIIFVDFKTIHIPFKLFSFHSWILMNKWLNFACCFSSSITVLKRYIYPNKIKSQKDILNWEWLTRVSIPRKSWEKWLRLCSLELENCIFISFSFLNFQDFETKIIILFWICEILLTILFLFMIFMIVKTKFSFY